ncbi:hypothetical protein CCUS01_13048 [Colletotrichum cuscutae]|uniref:Uncharacterized protein n=1 Tax=Colletotrichum cuscutae TaxID=1209917 RepID=A0AAI9YCR5_9PEZI|nr:hypothetical protein CCUS01_13048 [Colletotrichum cuscutae]
MSMARSNLPARHFSPLRAVLGSNISLFLSTHPCRRCPRQCAPCIGFGRLTTYSTHSFLALNPCTRPGVFSCMATGSQFLVLALVKVWATVPLPRRPSSSSSSRQPSLTTIAGLLPKAVPLCGQGGPLPGDLALLCREGWAPMASACQLAYFPEGLTHLTIGNSLSTKVLQTRSPTSIPCSARRWLSFGNGGQCGELGKEILTAQVPEEEHGADEATGPASATPRQPSTQNGGAGDNNAK